MAHPAKHESRGNSTQRGYTYRWQQARKRFLAKHPLCKHCYEQGRVTAANEVDHITPHKGDQTLFWDEGNWQSLCKSCHSRKTAQENGANPKPAIGLDGWPI